MEICLAPLRSWRSRPIVTSTTFGSFISPQTSSSSCRGLLAFAAHQGAEASAGAHREGLAVGVVEVYDQAFAQRP